MPLFFSGFPCPQQASQLTSQLASLFTRQGDPKLQPRRSEPLAGLPGLGRHSSQVASLPGHGDTERHPSHHLGSRYALPHLCREQRPDFPLAVSITRPSQDRPSLLACGLGGMRGSKWPGRPSQPQVKGALSRLLTEACLPPVSADVNRSPVLTGRAVTAPPPPSSATRELGSSTSVDTDTEPGRLWGALPGSTQLAL